MRVLYKKQVESQLEKLNKTKNFVEGKIDPTIKGFLDIKKKKGKCYYYHYYSEGGVRYQKYVCLNDPLKEKLIQNSYYKKLLSALNEEIGALQQLNKTYHPEKKYNIYEELSEERKIFINPLFSLKEDENENWESEKWVQYKGHPEGLRFDTKAGHKVRSKAERTIVNFLYENRETLSYRYEQEIYLKNTNTYVHPDFTIRNKLTGKIFYWEHAGMMDQIEYANDFVRKMNSYSLEGMFPADNFILTFETGAFPDNIKVENKFLQILLKG